MYFNSAVYVTEDSYLATYNIMRLGDIAFEGNRNKRFAHGRFVENTIGDGIVSHVFKVFRPVGNNFDLAYWKHAINNEKLMKDALTRSTKASTMMHELVSSDFLEESTLVPSLDEQRAIGTAIDSIDNLITLHQRKCQYRGLYGHLSWEQRKLGEVAPLQRGFDLPVNQMTPGPYPVVMSNGIGGWHSKYMVKGPGVVTGRSGTIGSLHYIEQNFWPHNTSLWVTSFNGNEPRFIYWLYASLDLERFGSGSGVPTLNRNDVHDLRVRFPCDVVEQRRIGTFFSRLDHLITLHQ